MYIHPSRFPAMAEAVERCNRAKGWYDKPVPFSQALALLHEEISEAGRAWRSWGLEDGTAGSAIIPGGNPNAKPEGVGAEFADFLIRWLDYESRFKTNSAAALETYTGKFGINDDFLTNMNTLHNLVSRVSMTAENCFNDADRDEQMAVALATPLAYLFQLAEHYGIDLHAEFERKLRHNWTRPYRHGDLRA